MTSHDEYQKSETARSEEKILQFWDEQNIFKKTLAKKSPRGEFVFYDGPPFATGLPHYGHVLPGSIKDAIPRYKTMRGYHVPRQWGWDCHGLPVENLLEKELGLKTRKDIEQFGIAEFNERARAIVLRYADDWRRIIPRTGRWVDMDNDYRTMDRTYTESVWWIFKTLYDRKLVYEGFKSMHLCPRCETTLSNFEVSQGYKEISDLSVTAKFKLGAVEDTYALAWTTTPWTLPGNAGLAVHEDLDYVKIGIRNEPDKNSSNSTPLALSNRDGGAKNTEYVILAKDRLKNVVEGDFTIEEEFKGKELIGMSYTPPFSYYKDTEEAGKNKNNWKIYHADFVNVREGTGVVHVAPAFGEDDMRLGRKHNLSLIQHVAASGTFKKEVTDFPGAPVKPKENHKETDVEIIKYLAARGLLFSKEKITHAYPHCWRCDTPLLNYASRSWFVHVTALKDQLVSAHKKVRWVPKEIGEGRFGKGLLTAPDWAMSRTRYWGAPIPVWKCGKCKKKHVAKSVEEVIRNTRRSGNMYFIMRHGEAISNTESFINAREDASNTLTTKGKLQAQKTGEWLRERLEKEEKKIDYIFVSPLERTKMTARIVAPLLGISQEHIKIQQDIRETDVGVFEKKPVSEYHAFFSSLEERFLQAPEGGENLNDVKRRMTSFLYDLEENYKGANILIISHESPLWMLSALAQGKNIEETVAIKEDENSFFIRTGEAKELSFTPMPHNREGELDLHRPYIDRVQFTCECGGTMTRIHEVFDCWFESGAMPYGSAHFPFEDTARFNPKKGKGLPADFIAESIDQTRGWFYSLLVLGVALFKKPAYKNVITSGLVCGDDGKKMSKKLRNYPELSYTLDRYGADALRYYLLSSPLTRAETVRFLEKELKDIHNKVVSRLRNILSFYKLYKGGGTGVGDSPDPLSGESGASKNILDRWILVRLDELVNKVTYGLDHYELDKATRPIAVFIDDLSTWYIRRSRDRFKSDDAEDRRAVLATTRHVLRELSKVIAPTMPFVAEEVYQEVRDTNGHQSVHLEDWPKEKSSLPVWPNIMAFVHRLFGTHQDLRLLSAMEEVRRIVTLGLQARTDAKIKVRQPLAELKIKNKAPSVSRNEELIHLVKDEVNVKSVVFGADIESEVWLDAAITPELKKEGQLREFVRSVQELRKKEGLTPGQEAELLIKTSDEGKAFIESFQDEIKRSTTLSRIEWNNIIEGDLISAGGLAFIVKLSY